MSNTEKGKRDFLSIFDLSADEALFLVQRAWQMKKELSSGRTPRALEGRSVALIFEKASTRTRISFEVGVHQLGGQPLFISSKDTQMGRSEPLEDTARVLSRYVHMIMIRTYGQEIIEGLARHASIPVINGLSDTHHPCQVMSDLLTVAEHTALPASWTSDAAALRAGMRRLRVAWIGDGNNMANSWITASGVIGFPLVLACPEGYLPDAGLVERARREGADVRVVRSPREAARGADVINTDVWASMGQEKESADRGKVFAGYTVDAALMKAAAPGCVFLHCLPAHRGEEVTGEVIEGPASVVWDQAENRLHMQKAIMEMLARKCRPAKEETPARSRPRPRQRPRSSKGRRA